MRRTPVPKGVNSLRLRYPTGRIPASLHELAAVIALGLIPVVCSAHQRDILRAVIAASAERHAVMILELMPLFTPASVFAHKGAPTPVTLVHGALHISGNMARRRQPVDYIRLLFASLSLRKASGFQSLQLLTHRLLQDGGQITIRYRRAHEPPES